MHFPVQEKIRSQCDHKYMNINRLTFLTTLAISFLPYVLADSSTVIPDWTKWIFFFVGALILASIGWSLAFCCCPIGCMFRITILVVISGMIAVWGYFMFGPWWQDVIAKDNSG
jgi:hypothetical protein